MSADAVFDDYDIEHSDMEWSIVSPAKTEDGTSFHHHDDIYIYILESLDVITSKIVSKALTVIF